MLATGSQLAASLMLQPCKSVLVGSILLNLAVFLAEVIVGHWIDCQSALAGRSHVLVSLSRFQLTAKGCMATLSQYAFASHEIDLQFWPSTHKYLCFDYLWRSQTIP